MKSLWAAWLIYYSDIKGKFNKKAFDTLSRLEKYFMYLPCKYILLEPLCPFALDFRSWLWGTATLITSIMNFIYGLIKLNFATINLIEIFTSSSF